MYPGCNLAVAVFQYETIVMSTADILMHQSVRYVQVPVVIQLLTFQQSWCQQITELCYLMYILQRNAHIAVTCVKFCDASQKCLRIYTGISY